MKKQFKMLAAAAGVTFIAATLTLALQGCDPDTSVFDNTGVGRDTGSEDTDTSIPPADGTADEESLVFSYELPEGWEWEDREELVAMTGEGSKDGVSPFVKLEPGGFPDGTAADARAYVMESFDEKQRNCDAQKLKSDTQECDYNPEYKELQIAGTTVYMFMYTMSFWGAPSWTSVFTFEKEGHLGRFVLYDRADLYQDEIGRIIETFHWQKSEN